MAYDDNSIDDTSIHAEEIHQPVSGLPITEALEQLRLRLLDLTGRNKLINFKHGTGKTIQFVETDFNDAFESLTSDSSRGLDLDFVPEPPKEEWETKNGRTTRPEAKVRLHQLGRSTSYDLTSNLKTDAARTRKSPVSLSTLYYADELGKHGRKLTREARLAIEETGANMLHLVFGFLEFPESPGSEKTYQAPLLCVPVAISVSNQGQYSRFAVTSTGEEITDNLSLREKIKRDFGLNMPVYLDEDEESGEAYLRRIERAIKDLPGWKVQRRITLTLLSFSNMLMVKDIAPETWADASGNSALLEHPLIRQVFEGSNASNSEPSYADEYDIDNHPKGELPLIYDADSSQHSALIDVLEGKNRVIEGPPGTGKSQTITNIIAASLQAGKTVLFVAEKLAALEVVKTRLEQAGLEQFVLELHSNKTNKKRVLEDLKRRMDMRAPRLGELPERLVVLNEKKEELRTHMLAMKNSDSNKLELTLHQVMWRAELNRLRCKDADAVTANIEYPAAIDITVAQHQSLVDKLKYAANQYDIIGRFDETHPFWGFYPNGFAPQDSIPIQRILDSYVERFDSFRQGLNEAIRLLDNGEVSLDKESASKLINVLAELAPADPAEVDFNLLPSLFSANDRNGRHSIEVLTELAKAQLALTEMENTREEMLIGAFPVDDAELAAAHETVRIAETLGLADKNLPFLRSAHAKLNEAAKAAATALDELDRIATHFGLEFNAGAAFVKQLEVLGEAFIKSHYVGETAINRSMGHYISLYKSPEAAALAALSECSEEDVDPDNDKFSVDVRRCDDELLYAADVGLNDNMTHTDTEGFIFFLKGWNWLDSEWVTDVYDLELSDSSCAPPTLQFDVKYPWTLHEARAVARIADKLLRTPNCYYRDARPDVYELEGNHAMLIIFDDSAPKIYGILDEEGILELERKIERFNVNDFDYAHTMYKGLELCYYTSKEPDCRTGNFYF